MKYFALATLIFSFNALACWKMKADLTVGGKTMTIDQKMDHDKTYSFPSAPYIFHVKVYSTKNHPENMPKKKGANLIEINVEEKTGTSLTKVSSAMLLLKPGMEGTMTKHDAEKNLDSKFVVKLTEI